MANRWGNNGNSDRLYFLGLQNPFPSGEPGVSGDFWGSQEGCQGPSRPLPAGDTCEPGDADMLMVRAVPLGLGHQGLFK